ncbi:MAG: AarF/UbiB family protein [Gammaproteobacteria bacterium]|nr:AarF/UbiB family protein [Gammaproteobacteria bacterium]
MAIKTRGAGGRTGKILGVGLRTLGRSVLNKLPGGDRLERTALYWAEVGEDWAQTLGELRGAAMKMGQLASQYADVLPPQLGEQLKKLQRSVEPLPFADIAPLLDAQWTAAQRKRVRSVEPQAIAAASIGQVHRAVLSNGAPVVIKVRYPGVVDAVDADVAQLKRLIGLSKLLPVDSSAIDTLMAEVRDRFREETDYGAELGHLKHLRQHAKLAGIVYPKPVEALCADGILVLSEEAGATLEIAKSWPQELRDALGLALSRWALHQLFVALAVHADPHPGNFAFRPTGELVVYDFGCVKRLSRPVADRVVALLNAAHASRWDELHGHLTALGGISDGVTTDQLTAFYRELAELILGRLAEAETFDFDDARFITDIRGAIKRNLGLSFKFKPVSDLLFVLRALSGHYWILRALRARVPVIAILAPHGVQLRPGPRPAGVQGDDPKKGS